MVLVVTCTICLRFQFWRRGCDRVFGARLFQGSTPQQIVPKRSILGSPKLAQIVPKKSALGNPQLSKIAPKAIHPRESMTLCSLKGCTPSEHLYALKGLVCPQGICMPQGTCKPSRDLGPMGPNPSRAHKSLEGIQIPWGHTSLLRAYISSEDIQPLRPYRAP